jgi:two-component system sensor kinase FixL
MTVGWFVFGLLIAAALAGAAGWWAATVRRRADQLEVSLAEQQQVEEALRGSEERYRVLFSEANDAILIMDDMRVSDCNARACRMFGYPRKELLGRTIESLAPDSLPGEEGAGEEGAIGNAPMTQSTVRSFQFRQKRKDGSLFDAEISLGTFRLNGKALVMAIIRDISERLRVDDERKKLIDDLEAKNDEMERFAYTISHDLKAPIFTIRGFLGFLKKDVEEGERQRAERDIEQIQSAVEKMGHLVDDLLELSRAGGALGQTQAVPLGKIAQEVIAQLAGRLEERHITVEVADDLAVVQGDRSRLHEVLQNLIENAVKFSCQDEPRVEVGTRRDGEETVTFVHDNGIGIEPRFHEQVFGLFARLDPEIEGTGIGLAIVKRVIEVHNGRIWIESEGEGSGTSFCFTLPESPVS